MAWPPAFAGVTFAYTEVTLIKTHDEIILEGTDSLDARIIDESEERYTVMKQRVLIWNRKTNRIEAPNPRFHSARR